MSIAVNQVTSPGKSIVLLQLQTNFSPFFSSQRNKKCFNCEGRGHSYKEYAFLYGTHKKEEEEEEEKEEVARGVDVVAMATMSL